MPDSTKINLIPTEVLKERSLKNQYRRFLYFSFGVLIFSFLAFAVVSYFLSSSNKELTSLKRSVASKQDEIKQLEDIAKKGAILTARLSFIDTVLKNRVYYSRIMEEIKLRSKAGVVVTGVSVKEFDDTYETSISGVASSTTVLQDYMLGLVAKPDNLFSRPKILEVSVREGESTATFKISLDTDRDIILGNK